SIDDGEPVQEIRPFRQSSVALTELSLPDVAVSEAVARQLVRQEAARGFDLREGSPIRITLLQLDWNEHILVLTMHHIVSDGRSIEIIIRELGDLYTAFAEGRPSGLPELAIQYADY